VSRTSAALIPLVLALAAPAAALDEALYARLLERHTVAVDDVAGVRVDYPAVARDPDWKRLLRSLERADPAALDTTGEKLAFWIDVYNILAIDVVARHWPVESIRDVGSWWSPVWKREAGTVGGRAVSLDEVEHGILRPLGDPRVHAAVVCASTSCPDLRREPYTAARIDAQLDDATRRWLADEGKGLRIDRQGRVVTLSRIFDWFAEDFEASGGVLGFAARFAPPEEARWLERHADDASVRYFDYDWSVNAEAR